MDNPLNNPSGNNLVRLPRRSKLVSPRVVHPETQERLASCNTDKEQVTRINVDSAYVPVVRSKLLSPRILRKQTREEAGSVLLPPLPSAQCLVKRTTAVAKHSSGTNIEALQSDKLARKNHGPNSERGKSVGIQARRFPQRLPPWELQAGSSSFEIPVRHGPCDIPAGIPQRELFNKPKPENTSREQSTSKAPEGLLPGRVPVGLEGGDVIVRLPTTQTASPEDKAQSDICSRQKKDHLISSPYLNDASITTSTPEKKLYLETVYSLPSSPTLPQRSIVAQQQRLCHSKAKSSTSSVSVPCTNEANNYTSSTSAPERNLCPGKVHSAPTSPNLFQRSEATRQQRFYHNETNSSTSGVSVPCTNEANNYTSSTSAPERNLCPGKVHSAPTSPNLFQRSEATRQQRFYHNETNSFTSGISVPCTNEANNYTSRTSAPERNLCPGKVHSAPTSPNLFQRSEATRQQRFYHNETNSSTSGVSVPCTNEANNYTSSTSAPERNLCPEKAHSAPSSPNLFQRFEVTRQQRFYHNETNSSTSGVSVPCIIDANSYASSTSALESKLCPEELHSAPSSPNLFQRCGVTQKQRLYHNETNGSTCSVSVPCTNEANSYRSSTSACERKLCPEKVHSAPSSPNILQRSEVTRQQRLYHNEIDSYTNCVSVFCTNDANSYTSNVSASCLQQYPGKLRSVPSSPAISRSVGETQQQSFYRNEANSFTCSTRTLKAKGHPQQVQSLSSSRISSHSSEFVRKQSTGKGSTKKRRPKHVQQHTGVVSGHVSCDKQLSRDTSNQSQLGLLTKENSSSATSHSAIDKPNFCSEAAGVLLSSFRDKETPSVHVNASAARVRFVLEQENASLKLRRRENELTCSDLDHSKPQKTVKITKKPQQFFPTEYSYGEEQSQQRDGNLQEERHGKEQVEQTTLPLGYESAQILHAESLPFTLYQSPSCEEGQNCIEEGKSVLKAEQSTQPSKSCPVSPYFTSFERRAMSKDVEHEADSQSKMEKRRPNANMETGSSPVVCWESFTATGQHCATDSDTRSKAYKSQTVKSTNFSFSDQQTSRRNAICDALLPAEFYTERSKFELLYAKCVLGETKLIAPYI